MAPSTGWYSQVLTEFLSAGCMLMAPGFLANSVIATSWRVMVGLLLCLMGLDGSLLGRLASSLRGLGAFMVLSFGPCCKLPLMPVLEVLCMLIAML